MRFAALVLVLTFSLAMPVRANTPDQVLMTGLPVIPDAEMAELRGGFIDLGGFIYRFAVDIRTQVDGALTFVRSMVIAPDQAGQFTATGSSTLETGNLAGTAVAVVGDNAGVAVTQASGSTLVLNQKPDGTPSSIIINTANDVSITQTLNIDLTLQSLSTILNTLGAGLPGGLGGVLNQSLNLNSVGLGL